MAKSKKKKKTPEDPNSRIVCKNRKARHEYEILEEFNCGISLQGSEVKSIRNNKISLEEAFARVSKGEIWLMSCDIAEYPQANLMNHEPTRPRKLLMKKREIRLCAQAVDQDGFTLIPTLVYFSRGYVKIKLAIAKGRKLYDKREKLRKQDDTRMLQASTRKYAD